MTEESFWKIIADSRKSLFSTSENANPAKLKKLLSRLPDEDITDFMTLFEKADLQLNSWDIWGAGYLLNGGMSNDGFIYFRAWIIGKGKEAFDAAVSNPDRISEFVEKNSEFENELLRYVAIEICEERDLVIPDDLSGERPAGEEWEEEDLQNMFPKCWEAARKLGNA